MFRRVRFDLRAIQCDVTEFDQPCCLTQLQNLQEQLAAIERGGADAKSQFK